MDSMRSFKGYGKVDDLEQEAFQRKTRKRLLIIIISSIILLAVVVAAVAVVVIHKQQTSSSDHPVPSTQLTPAASLKAVCNVTRYPNSCSSSISPLPDSNTTTDPEQIFKLSLRVAIDELSELTVYPSKLKVNVKDPRLQKAIDVCEVVLEDALDQLNESALLLEVSNGESMLSPAKISDIETWLSATMTNQETCLDAIRELNSSAANETLHNLKVAMQNSTELVSNSLAIVSKILGLLSDLHIPLHRRLLGFGGSDSVFPDWVGPAERRLLQEDKNNTTANLVVAQDGSGQFKNISAALATVKQKSKIRTVIHIKEGVYVENINLGKNYWNVMIYGDGMNKTIISGCRNYMDGAPTFDTATLAVKGKGFIAKDIGFKNTAGPDKHQAVALRSGSDQSVFYRCSFDGYQDTLYAHSNRQFYRECDITGTIDFIFGNAAVVFQSCNIKPVQPLGNQFNTITAQGKNDPNQNTGISIQKCILSAPGNLTAPTYLGRPWKDFSTTAILQSEIGSFLSPLGWTSWVPNVDPPKTIFYAEYKNSGPGSDVTRRVKWAGYRPTLTEGLAGKLTVQSLIQGTKWLPEANVKFETAL